MHWFIFGIGALLLLGGSAMAKSDQPVKTDPFYRWDDLLRKYASSYGVPFEWMKAIMGNESNYGQAKSVARGLSNPEDVEGSKSSDGKSWGLMQLTLPTARMYENVTAADLNNPETSIRIAARYLAYLGKLKNWDREAVIRSYNGGPGYLSTVAGVRDTPVYYSRFLVNLKRIQDSLA